MDEVGTKNAAFGPHHRGEGEAWAFIGLSNRFVLGRRLQAARPARKGGGGHARATRGSLHSSHVARAVSAWQFRRGAAQRSAGRAASTGKKMVGKAVQYSRSAKPRGKLETSPALLLLDFILIFFISFLPLPPLRALESGVPLSAPRLAASRFGVWWKGERERESPRRRRRRRRRRHGDGALR